MSNNSANMATADPDSWISLDELCEYLGNIPKSTIESMRSEGRAPKAIKVGRQLRFKRRDVLEWEKKQELR